MRVILIGSGKLVYFLAKQFINKAHHLTIITADPLEATALSRQFTTTVILGDGSNPTILKEAGAYQADIVLSLTVHDEDNLVACQIAQKHFGVPRTIAMVNDPDHQEVFQKLGITFVFSATKILANLIEKQADFENIKSFLSVAEGKINITEITLPPDSPAVGKTLQELNLPGENLIASIIREGEVKVPRGGSCLQALDRLILISQPEHYEQFLRTLTGEETKLSNA